LQDGVETVFRRGGNHLCYCSRFIRGGNHSQVYSRYCIPYFSELAKFYRRHDKNIWLAFSWDTV